MTAHPSRLPMGLAPLIAEAKRRMRRRRSIVALLVALAGLAIGLALAFRTSAPGPGTSLPLTRSNGAVELRVSVPRGFHRYAVRGGPERIGTRPPVIGEVITDFPLPSGVTASSLWGHWAAPDGPGPPANVVALKFARRIYGPAPPARSLHLHFRELHLPLTANQPWFEEKLKNGKVGYRWGSVRLHNDIYGVMYWSGPAAPAKDRAAILRALTSIRPVR